MDPNALNSTDDSNVPRVKRLSGFPPDFEDLPTLVTDSPFGDLQLKLFEIELRLEWVNWMVRDAFLHHVRVQHVSEQHDDHTTDALKSRDALASLIAQKFASEQVIYWLRKTSDELIGLLFVSFHFSKTRTFPRTLHEFDSVGRLLNAHEKNKTSQRTDDFLEAVASNVEKLRALNEVANGIKHSFVNADAVFWFEQKEPAVATVCLSQNNLKNPQTLHIVTLRWVIDQFSNFYEFATQKLELWSIIKT